MYQRRSISPLVLAAALAIGALPGVVSAQDEPLVLERSATIEQDGVRLSMSIEQNPLATGRPAWITTKVKNTGTTDLLWENGHCDTAVAVRGVMDEEVWRDGEPAGPTDYGDFKFHTTHWRIDYGPTIQLEIESKDGIGTGGTRCSEIAYTDRIPPGKTLKDRVRWDGTAQWQLGLPPSGTATLTGRFGEYKRRGERGPMQALEVSLPVLVVNGLAADRLHPMEIIDAAVADPGFAALMEPIDVGDNASPLVHYDPDMDLWNVGIVRTEKGRGLRETFRGGLVDPVTGEVVAIIERPWVLDEDPRVESD
ncbi:MAG: hypothetical protein U9O18_01320 [Chloroflexota bacterium]|nr:hypothetical protein [Chloroflexota bacterium]